MVGGGGAAEIKDGVGERREVKLREAAGSSYVERRGRVLGKGDGGLGRSGKRSPGKGEGRGMGLREWEKWWNRKKGRGGSVEFCWGKGGLNDNFPVGISLRTP